jgi:hypothetical protein
MREVLSMPILIVAAIAVLSVVVYIRRHSEKVKSSGPPPEQPVVQPVAKVDDSRTEADERERGHADLAALLGAVVVIILTLTLQPGAWGFISTVAGTVVLCVLIAFFARQPSSVGRTGAKWESVLIAVVFAAMVGIAGAVTGAWPLQDHFFADSQYCRAVGVNAATSAVRDLTATGLDDATPDRLHKLVKNQLNSPTPLDDGSTLGDAFYRAYTSSFGDCQSDYVTDRLWWIALPLFGATLIWWIASFWKARAARKFAQKISPMNDPTAKPQTTF